MNLHLDDSLNVFREAVRKAIAEDLPANMRERQIAHGGLQSEYEDMLAWMRILARRGWNVPRWPVELEPGCVQLRSSYRARESGGLMQLI